MKLSENSNEVLQRAVNLKRSKNVPELEESIRLFKIYSKMTQVISKKIEAMSDAFESCINLINVLENPDRKFWQFKIAIFGLLDLLKLIRFMKGEEKDKDKYKNDVMENIKRLLGVMAPQRIKCNEFIHTSEFRRFLEDRFGNRVLIEVLTENKNDISMSMIRQLPQEVDLYSTFMGLFEQAFQETASEQTMRPVSSQYFVPLAPQVFEDALETQTFETEFLEEFKNEFKRHLYLDEESFFRFLLKNYQIPLTNGFMLNEFDAEILTYKKEIVGFFMADNFQDPTEKKVVKVIRDGLKQRRLC